MGDIGWGFMGIHAFWWLFWIVLIIVLFALIKLMDGGGKRLSPIGLLKQRYAVDEISGTEYLKRKAMLDDDVNLNKPGKRS